MIGVIVEIILFLTQQIAHQFRLRQVVVVVVVLVLRLNSQERTEVLVGEVVQIPHHREVRVEQEVRAIMEDKD